jgi:hypothetical protein
VLPIAGITDRYHRFVVDGTPDIRDTLERIGDKTPPPFPGPDRQGLLRLIAGN